MSRQFKVHDRVMIAKQSRFYKEDPLLNPTCGGKVIEITNQSIPVRVLWDTDKTNAYAHSDLEYCDNAPPPTPYIRPSYSTKPDGGPQDYYDLPPKAVTLNDLIEFKSEAQWLGHSPHLMNIFKACWRWGVKDGTTKEYDAKKIIYYGCRLLRMLSGNDAVRKELQKLLNDPQFKE